jgi:hypothetical protein
VDEDGMSALGTARKRFWGENGFLILPGFFSSDEVDGVLDAHEKTWMESPAHIVVDDLDTGRRARITELSAVERRHRFKVNDLYLTETAVRQAALSERMGIVLEELLGDEPAICNTLNFTKGSQQADHIDTLYMTPPDEHGLIATWMALEDALEGSGPLRYYPGSHSIPPYRFSNGKLHTIPEEMALWSDHMADQVERYGLEEEVFYAKKGDLFIWSAFLLHGGSAIVEPGLTRQSLVTHYWTQSQCDEDGWSLRPAEGGWWILKPHLEVPATATPHNPIGIHEVEEPDFPAALSATDSLQVNGDLRARMDALAGVVD